MMCDGWRRKEGTHKCVCALEYLVGMLKYMCRARTCRATVGLYPGALHVVEGHEKTAFSMPFPLNSANILSALRFRISLTVS